MSVLDVSRSMVGLSALLSLCCASSVGPLCFVFSCCITGSFTQRNFSNMIWNFLNLWAGFSVGDMDGFHFFPFMTGLVSVPLLLELHWLVVRFFRLFGGGVSVTSLIRHRYPISTSVVLFPELILRSKPLMVSEEIFE